MKISAVNSNKILQKADKEVAILVYSNGNLAEDKKFWAYSAILPSRYNELKEAEKAGNYDLQDYGDVLAWGYGDAPPPDAKKEIEMLLNANQNFEQEINQIFNKFIKDFTPGFADIIIMRKLYS